MEVIKCSSCNKQAEYENTEDNSKSCRKCAREKIMLGYAVNEDFEPLTAHFINI